MKWNNKYPNHRFDIKLLTKQENNYGVSLLMFKFFQNVIRHPVWECVALHYIGECINSSLRWQQCQLQLDTLHCFADTLKVFWVFCRIANQGSQKTKCKYCVITGFWSWSHHILNSSFLLKLVQCLPRLNLEIWPIMVEGVCFNHTWEKSCDSTRNSQKLEDL